MTKRRDLQGVFAVKPRLRAWKYDGPELQGQYINVKRRQVPLAPAKVLPLYSMQGMTASPGLVAHWVLPARVASDIKKVDLLRHTQSRAFIKAAGSHRPIR